MAYEIFRAGTRTDNNGQTVTISEADVAAAAAAYDPGLHEAPIVVGHPKTDAPAYGWVGGLSASGGTLTADFAQVDDSFAGLVRDGRYKKVSASFYPPDSPNNPKPGVWYLRHVGFLGAQPPAVKGLQPVSFAEDDVYVEFSEVAHRRAASIFRRLRDWLIEQYDIATADKVVSDWEIRDIEETAAWKTTSDPAPLPAFADPQSNQDHEPNKEDDMATEEQLAAEKAAREKAEAEAEQAKADLKKLQDEQEKGKRDAAHQQNADFAESLVKQGRLKPADKGLVIQALDFAEYPDHTTADFGEGEAKKPLGAALRDFLSAVLPGQLPTGELAKGSVTSAAAGSLPADFAEAANPEALSHHERAVALSRKEGISYADAARRTAAG